MTMCSLKYKILWLFFLLVNQDVQLIHGASLTIKTCPPTYSNECPPDPYDSCHDDQDCEARYPSQGLKCCNDCGKSCVTPEITQVKATPTPSTPAPAKTNTSKLVAKCPTSPPSSEFPPEPDQECQNDTICDAKFPGQGLKCCSDGCNFRCIPPVMRSNTETYEVQGTCPVSSKNADCPRPADDECQDDSRCRELHPGIELKCCKDGCDFRCVPPIGENVPIKTEPITVPANTHVTQKTTPAPTSIIYECPIWPAPGGCPPEQDDECKIDAHCNALHPGLGLKCCDAGCHFRCQTPIAVNVPKTAKQVNQQTTPAFVVKGTCPIFPTFDECAESDHECRNDKECYVLHPGLGLKCCKDGCDRRCLPPIQGIR